jgi:hypothetical protein
MNLTKKLCLPGAWALLVLAVASPTAPAAFIPTGIEGEYTATNPVGPQAGITTFTLTDGVVRFLPNPSFDNDSGDLRFNVSNFSSSVLFVPISPATQARLVIFGSPSGQAVFRISNPGLVTRAFPPDQAVRTDVALLSNTIPNLDLRRYSTGTLTVIFENITLSSDEGGSASYPPPGGFPPDGFGTAQDFVYARFFITPTGAEIPEPATLAVWGAVGAVGLAWRWRRRRAR